MNKKSEWGSTYNCQIYEQTTFKADAIEYRDGLIVFYLSGEIVASCGLTSVFVRRNKVDSGCSVVPSNKEVDK